MRVRVVILTAALAIGWAAPTACGQSVVNGSFELGSPSDGGQGYTSVSSGSTAITGWTVGGGGVDWIGSYWQAAAGNRSVDLSATSPGSLSQAISGLTIGQQYRVSFAMAGNPDGGNVVKSLNVQATNGTTQTYTFDTTGKSRANMGWTTKTYDFVASSTIATLTFTGLDNNAFGAAIDNVTIAPVPEPTSIMAIATVAGLAVRTVRRRRAATA